MMYFKSPGQRAFPDKPSLFVRRSLVCRHLKRFKLNAFLMACNFSAIRHLAFHIPTLKCKAFTIVLFNFQFFARHSFEKKR